MDAVERSKWFDLLVCFARTGQPFTARDVFSQFQNAGLGVAGESEQAQRISLGCRLRALCGIDLFGFTIMRMGTKRDNQTRFKAIGTERYKQLTANEPVHIPCRRHVTRKNQVAILTQALQKIAAEGNKEAAVALTEAGILPVPDLS